MRELNNQEGHSSEDMPRNYFDHPSADVLERFILHRSSEEETELVETHTLACESCVSALENLELEIAATKLALQEIAAEQRETKRELKKPSFWTNWFSVPSLSWAGVALAACAFCLFAFIPANVELKSERGVANLVVPEWRNTHLKLIDGGLQPGPLRADVVNQAGSLVWSGAVNSANGEVAFELPRFTNTGQYYARLYSSGAEHELLGEFPFEVKFEFF